MAYENCKEAIEEAAGRVLAPEEQDLIGRRVGSIMRELKRNEREGFDPTGVLNDLLQKERDSLEVAKIVAKRIAVLNSRSRRSAMDYIKSTWADDYAGGLLALVKGVNVDRFGARESAASVSNAARHGKKAAFVSELENADLMDAARSGEFDLEVRRAARAMDEGGDTSGFSETAVELANIYRRHYELARLDYNRAGGFIGKLPGFVASQTHNMWRIARAAGRTFKHEDNFRAWRDKITPLLDWDKTMPGVLAQDREKVLRSLWTQFSSGKHLNFSDRPPAGTGLGFASLAKRRSQERVLVFKSPEAEHTYFKEFGEGDSLYDNAIHSLDLIGRDIGIMRKLGPNARDNVERVFRDLERELNDAGELDKLMELRKQHQYITDKVWPVLTGEASVSDNLALAGASETALQIQRLADLGGIVPASFSDITNVAANANFYGDRTAGGYFKETAEAAKSLMKVFQGTSRDERALAAENRILLEGVHLPVSNQWSDSEVPGALSKATQFFFKYNGNNAWQNRVRTHSMLGTTARYGLHRDLSMDKLPIGMQKALDHYGINSDDWNIIRQAETTDYKDTPLLSTGAVERLPDSVLDAHPDVAQYVGVEGKENVLAGARTRLKTKLSDKYGILVSDIADISVTMPNETTRAIMTQGLRRGTVTGELMRHFMLYRTYSVGFMQRHLGRELFAYHPDRVGIAQSIARMARNPQQGQLTGMATLIAGGLFWGHLSNAFIDIIQGKKATLVPTSPEEAGRVMYRAFVRAGSIGVYGDLFSQHISEMTSGKEYLFSLLGPSAKRASDFIDPVLAAATGSWGDADTQKAFKNFYNTLPGRNLFYTRWATDTLIYYNISEQLNPGYVDRMERFQEDELGVEYYMPPSEIIE